MIILIIILIGFLLRLISINQSFWLDEAISINAATKYSLGQIITQFSPKDFNPALYYIFLNLWLKIFPSSEFWVRLPSVIFGILTCYFVYKISLIIFKEKIISKIALLLLITSPLHIYYSQEARAYSMTAFLVSGSIYYFIKLLEKNRILYSLLFTLYSLLMLYSHYLSWLILPVQGLYLFLKKKQLIKSFIFYLLSFILFYLPWLPILFQQLSIGQRTAQNLVWNDISGALTFKNLGLIPIKFIIGRTSFDNKIVYGFLMVLILSLFSYLIWKALNSCFSRVRQDQTEPRQDLTEPRSEFEIIVWLWLIIPIIFGIIVSIKIPVFSYFRFLFCLPAFYILISKGVISSKHKYLMLCAVLFINVFFSFRYLLNPKYHREDWKSAVNELHILNPAKEKVLLIKNVSAPFEYYDQKESDMGFVEEKELYVNETNIWLIPYAQPIFDPQDTTRTYLKNKDFVRTYEKHFRGVTLEKWQKLVASRYN